MYLFVCLMHTKFNYVHTYFTTRSIQTWESWGCQPPKRPIVKIRANRGRPGALESAEPVGEALGPTGQGGLQVGAAVGALEVAVAEARGARRTALDLFEAVEDGVDLFS